MAKVDQAAIKAAFRQLSGIDGGRPIGDRIVFGALGAVMRAKTTIGIVAAVLLGTAGPSQAQAPDWDRAFRPAPQTVQQKRAPTRIIVRPVRPLTPGLPNRHDSTEFPRSDNLGFPGRNAVRQCKSWLQTEYRLSGTVVTPQMRCWWERG